MASLYQILNLLLDIAWFIMLVHLIMSWLLIFNILNIYQPVVGTIWNGLNALLEPFYRFIRQFLPRTQGLDLAPLVGFVLIIITKIILQNNAVYFLGG